MATKIQLESLVKKILGLQYCGETIHVVYFDPYSLAIHTADGKIIHIDTDGKEMKKYEK